MLPRKTVGVLFLLALIWLASAPMLAQTSMGGVNGTVTDSQGAVLPGATVTLTSEDTNVATVRQTNGSGYFVFVNVRPGPYVLTVELQGLKTARVDRFIVGVNETVARNVTLQVGQVTEVVQVKGGTSELLQTTSAALGQVIEQKLIRELPSQGRNFLVCRETSSQAAGRCSCGSRRSTPSTTSTGATPRSLSTPQRRWAGSRR